MPELGKIDLLLRADEAQVTDAYSKAGKAAAEQASTAIAGIIKQAAAAAQSAGGAGVASIQSATTSTGSTAISKAVQVASIANQASSMIGGVAGEAGAFISRIVSMGKAAGIAGALIAVEILAITKFISTMKQWTEAMLGEARRLSYINGQLAGAEAMAMVREIVRDAERARTLGSSLAALTRQSEDLKDALAPWRNTLDLVRIDASRTFALAQELMVKGANSIAREIERMNPSASFSGGGGGIAGWLRSHGLGIIAEGIYDEFKGAKVILKGLHKELNKQTDRLDRMSETQATVAWNGTILRALDQLSGGRLNPDKTFFGGRPTPHL